MQVAAKFLCNCVSGAGTSGREVDLDTVEENMMCKALENCPNVVGSA